MAIPGVSHFKTLSLIQTHVDAAAADDLKNIMTIGEIAYHE